MERTGEYVELTNERGLNEEEVSKSRSMYGANILTKKKRKGFLRSFFSNFGDPMIKVLLIALGINVIFLFGNSNLFESVGIAASVLIAVVVSTVSEYGSESAFEKLRADAMSVSCRVRRNGFTVALPVSDVVRGDIILLGAGERIPADGVIVSGRLELDQSALNGESKEARKFPGADDGKAGFLSTSRLFSGSVATAGNGAMRVTEVGDRTFYGKLALEIQEEKRESPLKHRLEGLAKKISLFGYIGAFLVAFSYLFNAFIIDNGFQKAAILASLKDKDVLFPHLLHCATLAVTVIVMSVPEGLPMMITVVLSSNMRRMIKDNVLVRKLNGIETAGSMNILFTDKTGTLTYGKPEVLGIVSGDGTPFLAGAPSKLGIPPGFCEMLTLSLRENSAAEMSGGAAIGGNATDRALLEYAQTLHMPSGSALRNGVRRVSQIPFTSEAKFSAAVVELKNGFSCGRFAGRGAVTAVAAGEDGRRLALIKGAPEKILPLCTSFYGADGKPGGVFQRRMLERITKAESAKAVRIVAVATGVPAAGTQTEAGRGIGQFGELCFVGLVLIRDRVRSEARRGIAQIKSAGIQVVMITGDSKATAEAIAKETGIADGAGDVVLSSEEMGRLTDAELQKLLPRLRVVSRALPGDKSRLVRVAQSQDLVAGMTGDGVNDAPALKKADVGFSMGSGTEVAKEAGDIVVLDDNIMSISRAVSYGRTIFKSIRKFIIFQLTINFCAMAVSIIAPFLHVDMPITVIQMLWINLVMDTLAGLAFGGERPRKKYMQEPPKKRGEPIINAYMWNQIIFSSVFTAAVSLWFLKSGVISGIFGGHNGAYMMTAFFTLFMFNAIFNSLNARTHELNLFDYLALNKQFLWIMSAILVIQVLLVYFGGGVFRTEALEIKHFLLITGLSATVLPADLLRKLALRAAGKKGGT